jgi:HK97 family phage prohead protease
MNLTYSPMYTKAVDVKSRSVEAILSSETIDGHGEIVDQSTWNLARYLKNPVVLYQHNANIVVGRAEDIRVLDGKLQARIVFATTPNASEVFQLFVDRAMRAFSVGFRPGRVAQETLADGRTVRRLLDCELYETSAVSMPSNPDAVVKHKSLGLIPQSFQLTASEEIARLASKAAFGALPADPAPSGNAGQDLVNLALHRAEGVQ